MLHLAAFPAPALQRENKEQAGRDLDPQRGWYVLHQNILEFLREIPPAQELATWLGVRTDAEAIEAMKHPEQSPYACFGPPGARYGNDRFFLEEPVLRPGREQRQSLEGLLRWRKDGQGFLPQVKALAQEFGYE